MSKKTFEFARNYVQKMGWSVIPLKPKDKVPLFPWKEFQERLPTMKELTEWFDGTDNNIAIVTGGISGLVVVDSDDGNEKPFGLHTPVMVRTSKGFHLYFDFSEDLHNTARIQEQLVDIRGEGGFVVAPPSTHPSGAVYEWKLEQPKLTDNTLPLLPIQFLEQQKSPKKRLEVDKIIGKGKGDRNTKLYQFACSLEGKPEMMAWNSVVAMNETFKPPLSDQEVRTIFGSAMNKAEYLTTPKPQKVSDLVGEIQEMIILEKEAPSTGFDRLDSIIKGFIPSHLYTLTGETNAGKTALACNFALRVAQQEKKVLYLALEPDIMITSVFASLSTGRSFQDLELSDYSDMGIDIITGKDCRSYEQMEAIIEENGERYDLIIIDHVGYIVPDKDNQVVAQSMILKKLALGAKKLKTAIMVIAHPRKTLHEKVITMNDIAGSASFKQDSTEVLILHREKANDDQYSSEMSMQGYLQVAKKKVTSVTNQTTIRLYFQKNNPLITDYDFSSVISNQPNVNNTSMVESFFNVNQNV